MKEWFDIDVFAYPWVLTALGIIPLFLLWYNLWYSRRRLLIKMSYDPTKLKKSRLNLSPLRHIPLTLQLLGVFFAIVALARPQSASEIVEQQSEGIDIMVLLDVSGSMEANDFKPNRLEVAKEQAINFISGRKNDRIGMILFAEDAFSYAPLTLDYELLNKLIKNISFGIVPKQGTAIGSAISIGIHRMRESPSKSKVMLLFTDGASNRGQIDPITAARLSKLHNIKIHTVSIGRENFGGGETGADESDPEMLQKVAKLTAGDFFRANDEKALAQIFQTISDMEKSEVKEEVYRDVTDLYPTFLSLAILSFLLAYLFMLSLFYNPLEQ